MHERLKSSPCGMAEEIRQRLQRTFDQDAADAQTRDLLDAIDQLATWVRLQTNHTWHAHAASHWVFRTAITARLQRLRPAGEREFTDGELPKALLVATTEPEAMGLGIEAIEFQHRQQRKDPRVSERLKAVREKATRELRRGTRTASPMK